MIKIKGNGIIKDFKMHKHQVTQEKFEKIMGFNPSHFKGDKLPVENLTWYDALMYCNKLSEKKKLTKYYDITNIIKNKHSIVEADVIIVGGDGYRLSTNEEWVWAAKGGNKSKGYIYSGSDDIDEVAWYEANSGDKTHPVGEKKPNELGLYDMSGNVWEWCYHGYLGSYRYNRGGSWCSSYYECEAVSQSYDFADNSYDNLGFRVCRSIQK